MTAPDFLECPECGGNDFRCVVVEEGEATTECTLECADDSCGHLMRAMVVAEADIEARH